jgi:hypothetical protein
VPFVHGPGQQVQLAPLSGPGSNSHSGLIDPCNLFCKVKFKKNSFYNFGATLPLVLTIALPRRIWTPTSTLMVCLHISVRYGILDPFDCHFVSNRAIASFSLVRLLGVYPSVHDLLYIAQLNMLSHSARVMRNENGESRGFGFVSYQTPDQGKLTYFCHFGCMVLIPFRRQPMRPCMP